MRIPKPEWMKIKAQVLDNNLSVESLLKNKALHTVCEEANCPNINECYGHKTVTFMILGNKCTRNCTFCSVQKCLPEPPDNNEPDNVALAVRELGLKHVVITSVTRDDLPDGGGEHFARVIKKIKADAPKVTIEVLIPDFLGSRDALLKVIKASPQVINHNIETVPRLYPTVRPMAIFERSLELLERVKKENKNILTKSGIMVGLGETEQEVLEVLKRLRVVGCDLLTIGQYLSPSKSHHPVVEYIHPDRFEAYKQKAMDMGFLFVASGPFVRSSYHAAEAIEEANAK